MSTPLTRRALLSGATAVGLAATLSPTATAAPRWRLMSEPVTVPLSLSGTTAPGYMGGLQWVAGSPIPRTLIKGDRLVIHPTTLGNWMNAHLRGYAQDRDRRHLTVAGNALEALAQRAGRRRGARFLAYEFEWSSSNGLLTSPWYSSFGQSKFPFAAHQLHAFTGERKWLQYRDEFVAAFHLPADRSRPLDPWIAGVDANNCLWLEEYPASHGRLSTVFNGHFYALWELGHYWAVSKDPHVRDLVQGAAATMDYYRNYCRRPGGPSNYYANTGTPVASYHYINLACYRGLFDATGVLRLGTTVDQMAADWRVTAGGGNLALAKAPLQVRRYSGGRFTAISTWTPAKAMTIKGNQRVQSDASGVWLRMADGPRPGWYVRETPGRAHYYGDHWDRVEFKRRRDVLLGPGSVTGWQLGAGGRLGAPVTRTFTSVSVAHSTTRAKVAGRQMILVQDGNFAGRWVPEGGPVRFR